MRWSSGTRSIRLVVFAAAAACVLAGCSSTPRSSSEQSQRTDVRRSAARSIALRAQQAEKAGKTDQAIQLYQEAVASIPDPPAQWWNNLGTLLLEKGSARYIDAAAAFKAAAAIDLMDPRPRINLGLVYAKAGHDAKALEAFNEALALDDYNLEALRAALRSTQRLHLVDQAALERASRGVMAETDPAWRKRFQEEKIRVESQLEARRSATWE